MRSLGKGLLVFALLVWLHAEAPGQSMVEHAAAAAGGSLAGMAGKTVNEGVSSIFGKLSGQTKKAAEVAAPSPQPRQAAPAAVPPEAVSVPPAPGAGVTKPRRPTVESASSEPIPPLPAEIAPPPPSEPEPPPLTREQFGQVQAGASRDEVFAKLGNPSARITIPAEGELVEILRYAARGETFGSLRLTNGVVSAVRVESR